MPTPSITTQQRPVKGQMIMICVHEQHAGNPARFGMGAGRE
jgi:hypothetical protein